MGCLVYTIPLLELSNIRQRMANNPMLGITESAFLGGPVDWKHVQMS